MKQVESHYWVPQISALDIGVEIWHSFPPQISLEAQLTATVSSTWTVVCRVPNLSQIWRFEYKFSLFLLGTIHFQVSRFSSLGIRRISRFGIVRWFRVIGGIFSLPNILDISHKTRVSIHIVGNNLATSIRQVDKILSFGVISIATLFMSKVLIGVRILDRVAKVVDRSAVVIVVGSILRCVRQGSHWAAQHHEEHSNDRSLERRLCFNFDTS